MVEEPSARGRVVRLEYESHVLERNPLGDPNVRDVWCYLPPGYDEGADRYPVIWVLAGFTGRGRSILGDSPWSPSIDRRMDRLIADGEAEPAILALPDCFTRYGGSQYVNSSATGRYEDYLCDELVPFVDTKLKSKGEGHRGVVGKSSGGFAALRLAMERPGVFSAAASHSGDVAFELCYQPDFAQVARALTRWSSVETFLDDFDAREQKTGEQIHVLNVLAMAACYSPSDAPEGFDLPFDLVDLQLRSEVWERWLAFDPLRMLERAECVDALRGLAVLFIDVGNRDEYQLDFGARRFVRRLEELGVRHRYEEFDGGHRSISWRYERSLPLLSRMLT